jgi:hypothetical protein
MQIWAKARIIMAVLVKFKANTNLSKLNLIWKWNLGIKMIYRVYLKMSFIPFKTNQFIKKNLKM